MLTEVRRPAPQQWLSGGSSSRSPASQCLAAFFLQEDPRPPNPPPAQRAYWSTFQKRNDIPLGRLFSCRKMSLVASVGAKDPSTPGHELQREISERHLNLEVLAATHT